MPTPLANSYHRNAADASAGYHRIGQLSAAEQAAPAVVTLELRERPEGSSLDEFGSQIAKLAPESRQYLDISTRRDQHGYAPTDEAAVRAWAARKGLEVFDEDPATRRLRLRGSVADLARAFNVNVDSYQQTSPDGTVRSTYRDYNTAPSLDADVASRVTNVLGLNTRPVAATKYVRLTPNQAAKAVSYNPEQVAAFYGFQAPPNGGLGLTINIGIAELGGAVNQADVATIKQTLGAAAQKAALASGATAAEAAAAGTFNLTEVGVDGATPVSDPSGADGEVALDWQVIARVIKTLAPQATLNIVVKYAPNTNQGFADVLASFATDGIEYSAVSTSWGGPKNSYAAADITSIHNAIQQVVTSGAVATFAAGDQGYTDGTSSAEPDYPSCDDVSLSIGGTTLEANTSTNTITSEIVWNELAIGEGASGGGVDSTQAVPSYQSANGVNPVDLTGKAGRGTPDLTSDADPQSGYNVLVNGQTEVIGGTSSGSPMVAAFAGLTTAIKGVRLGDIHDQVYALGAAGKGFNPITKGNDGANNAGYPAGPGWNAAAGWGSINGPTLVPAITSTVASASIRRPASPGVAL